MSSGARPRAATMADVAARAGVSRALVSIVFRGAPGASQATRARVMRAAEDLEYQPDARARLLGRHRSGVVGVVFSLRHEFHGQLVEELYRAAEETDFDLSLGAVTPSRVEQRAVQSLLDYRCEALVLLGPTLRPTALEELAARVPVVVVARSLRSRSVNVVRTDDRAGARLAVEHLAGLGHTSIAHVDGGRAPGAAERRSGYRQAMTDLGLARWVRVLPGGPTEEHGERAADSLLDGQATAVAAFNDHCAAGLVAALRERGLGVPRGLSVVGFDDSHIAGLASLRLTTVAQDAPALARSALQVALAGVEAATSSAATSSAGARRPEPGSRCDVVIPPRLVVRRTSGPMARSAAPVQD